MKTFTYANEYTVKGNIIDENELTYTIEFEAAPGFMDTVTFEKELTVVEEVEEKVKMSLQSGMNVKGYLVETKKYKYLVDDVTSNTIVVFKIETLQSGKNVMPYYWNIDTKTLKGKGGLTGKPLTKVMELINKK